LETSQARFRDVAEASSDWIWETDTDLRFTYFSSRFGDVTGIAAAAVLGKSLDQFFFSDAGTDICEILRETGFQTTFRDLRCCYHDAEGASRFCRLAGRPILDQGGAIIGYRGTATDITREVEAHAKASHLALHDALTELPNRVLLRERLNTALSLCRRENVTVSLLCIDLDHFKSVNDTSGHGAGDMLLKQVADRLRACVRSDETVARLGGDEFAVVQVGREGPEDTTALCRRILDCMNAPFQLEGQEFHVGASIGVAVAPKDGDHHEQLHKSADIALYRAKQAGRGTFRCFEAEMDAELQSRKALEQDLRQAQERGEFAMYYQPQISVDGQHLSGVEALLRWRHPKHGLISPLRFVPLAEETGLINAIGKWALQEACTQAMKWPGISLAVNLSAVQFKGSELVEIVRTTLSDTGLEPHRLELEITETVLLHDTRAALSILNDLKRLGVRVAMDDFGTGYSSMAYLNSFPFDKIKIDRSFISDLNKSDKSNAIVRSVISLGRSLGMVTTAEGVETLEQFAFLKSEGCQQIQGHYFGMAMPAEDFSRFLAEWERAAPESVAA
jgi:diguanylate cyclase (GGDEF)-like protein/PAS domain S-box-containing protein